MNNVDLQPQSSSSNIVYCLNRPINTSISSSVISVGEKINVLSIIRIVLGVFWLLDGILQLQPKMFTKSFVDLVLAPNLQNQPVLVSQIISLGITFFSKNIFFGNLISALVQIIMGVALIIPLPKSLQKIILLISLIWSLLIWSIGEGFGNIFTGTASFYTGAPGAVLLYAFLAVFILFPKKFHIIKLPKIAGCIFILGAILQSLPYFWTKDGLLSLFQLTSQDTVSLISYPSIYISPLTSIAPILFNCLLIFCLMYFGILLLHIYSRLLGFTALFFLAIIWWFFQDFGSILTFPGGTSTDFNSAPLLILFLLPLFLRNTEIDYLQVPKSKDL